MLFDKISKLKIKKSDPNQKEIDKKEITSNCWEFLTLQEQEWVFFTFFKLYRWYQIEQRTTFIYLTVYVRKVSSRIKSANLKTFYDLVENLWKSFKRYCETSQRIDQCESLGIKTTNRRCCNYYHKYWFWSTITAAVRNAKVLGKFRKQTMSSAILHSLARW